MDIKERTAVVSGDGAPMSLFVAEPASTGPHPVVLVFMEAFGVNEHIKNVTRRFAGEGFFAAAPDLFYRQGRDIVIPYTDIARVMPIIQAMNDVQTQVDIRVAIDFVKTQASAKAERIGCVGYCLGGTASWISACVNRDIKAAVVYYSGGLITRETSLRRPVSPHEYAPLLTAPVMGNFGETDQNPPAADVQAVDAMLAKMGKVHDFKLFAGAGHGFSCDERPSFNKQASEEAWARTLGWFGTYLNA